ncbi:MAG: tetratricopeptide repeat protein [Caldilineaceae bacterium]
MLDAIAAHAPGRVTCEFLRPATLNALVARLDDQDKAPVDILHFDGHGTFHKVTADEAAANPTLYGRGLQSEIQRERQVRRADDEGTNGESRVGAESGEVRMGFLLFENDDRSRRLVTAEELSANLFRANVGLVVLSACQTATLDTEGDPMASVAGKLTTTGIPAILAMTHAVLVPTTEALFGQFYGGLARGRTVARALDDARAYLDNNPEKYAVQRGETRHTLRLRDWFVPALYQGGNDTPLLTAAATPPPPATPRHNLRDPHEAGFFGRRRELWEIECWYTDGTRRISLTGFGGQGKTELAREAGAWLLRTGMFAAVVFVDYAQTQGADALAIAVSTVGAVLGESLIDANAVTAALTATPTLVILDNLETVAPDPLHELLSAAVAWSTAGGSRLLLTSRSPDFNHPDYRVAGTTRHRRLPLTGLGSAAHPDDALDWFTQLYGLPPAPTVRPPKRAELIRLFDRTAFHPLSIAVLAQQLKNERADRIDQRLATILATEAPPGLVAEGMPASLIASLQLSLERLSAEERDAVRSLGVFQGGAFEDDLLEITELDETQWPALRAQLEAAALIETEQVPDVRYPFLRFHPTLAPLLWAQLTQEEQTVLTTAHCRRYYALAGYLYHEDNKNPQFARAIARRELPNLRHAVDAALAAADEDAVDFVDSVNKFLDYFGLNRDAAALTARAEAIAGAVGSDAWFLAQSNRGEQLLAAGRIAEAATIFTTILQQLGETPSYQRVVTLGHLGRCYSNGGRPDLAAAQYRVGIAVTEQLEQNDGVKRQRGILHTDLANVLADQGDFGAARENYEQSLALIREIDDGRSEGAILGQLGTLAMREGNLTEAVTRYHAALVLFHQLHEPAMESVSRYQIGRALAKAKQWEQAETHYREAARLDEKLGNLAGAAQTWNQLAIVNKNVGKPAAAEAWYRKAIEAGRQLQDRGGLSKRLSNLANLLQSQTGRLAEARQLAEEALAIKQTLDPGAVEIWTTYNILAQIAEREGQRAQALIYRRQARAAKRNYAGTLYEMRRYGELIAAVVQLVQGDGAARGTVDGYLAAMRQNEELKLMANALEQLLGGERDADRLCDGLHYDPAMLIETILAALADPAVLEKLQS